MRRFFIGLVLGLIVVQGALAMQAARYQTTDMAADKSQVKCEMAFEDTVRTYTMYIPEGLKPGAPLVVFTHGYGSKSRWKTGLNAVAKREGFAVCYPDGSPDSRGKDGWNVGYPPQRTMPDNEVDFFRRLKREVCSRFSLSEENCFMTGMSNGGDLCYQLAFTAPGLFRAYASVAGLLFEHVYLNNPLPRPVPFMEIHGDADTTSYWTGDHDNKGGWGAYIPVPLAASTMAVANRCTVMTSSSFPAHKDPDRKVECTAYTNGPEGFDVLLYRIEGGKHSWGTDIVNTHELVWEFFARYVKK